MSTKSATPDQSQDIDLTLEHENETGTARVKRLWRVIDESTVRMVDREHRYSHIHEMWRKTHENVRDFDIDSKGRLVGDGSNWSGEGMDWREYAKQRHEIRLCKRFPTEMMADE